MPRSWDQDGWLPPGEFPPDLEGTQSFSFCHRSIREPRWQLVGASPPDRATVSIYRDEIGSVWILECHGCVLHRTLTEAAREFESARPRYCMQKEVAVAAWELQ